jgi:hypothetical protein
MNRMKKMLRPLGIIFLLSIYLYTTTSSITTSGLECVAPRVQTVPDSLKQEPPLEQKPRYEPREMPSWWQTEIAWQNIFKTGVDNENVNAVAIQTDMIWTAAGWRILRLDTITGETYIYDTFKIGDDPFLPLDLLVSHNGNLWALIYSVRQTYLALARYDPQLDKFEIVSDNQNTLPNHPNREIGISFVASQVLAETPDGMILIPFQGNILSYDPQKNTAQYLLPQNFPQVENSGVFPVTALLVYQNKAWFTISKDSDLRSVDLQTGELKNYGHIATLLDEPRWGYYMREDYRPIAVDGLGRIWMGYFARLTLRPDGQYTWEQIDLPPEFVVADDPDIRYLWASIDSVYTSSDGDLWFESAAGLIRYDAEEEQWCKSTPLLESYKVVEDSDSDLWMAINSEKYNGIYRYQLQP